MKRKKFLLFSAVFLLPVLIISCLIGKDEKNAARNDADNTGTVRGTIESGKNEVTISGNTDRDDENEAPIPERSEQAMNNEAIISGGKNQTDKNEVTISGRPEQTWKNEVTFPERTEQNGKKKVIIPVNIDRDDENEATITERSEQAGKSELIIPGSTNQKLTVTVAPEAISKDNKGSDFISTDDKEPAFISPYDKEPATTRPAVSAEDPAVTPVPDLSPVPMVTPQSTDTPCEHILTEITETIVHPALTHEEPVYSEWDEDIAADVQYCKYCGKSDYDLGYAKYDTETGEFLGLVDWEGFADHCYNCPPEELWGMAGYRSGTEIINTVHHREITEYRTVVDEPENTEIKILGYRCSLCGFVIST